MMECLRSGLRSLLSSYAGSMSLEEAWMEREQRKALRERFPGIKDAQINMRRSEVVAVAWNGLIGIRPFEDVELDDVSSLVGFFEDKLNELRRELAPEAL